MRLKGPGIELCGIVRLFGNVAKPLHFLTCMGMGNLPGGTDLPPQKGKRARGGLPQKNNVAAVRQMRRHIPYSEMRPKSLRKFAGFTGLFSGRMRCQHNARATVALIIGTARGGRGGAEKNCLF